MAGLGDRFGAWLNQNAVNWAEKITEKVSEKGKKVADDAKTPFERKADEVFAERATAAYAASLKTRTYNDLMAESRKFSGVSGWIISILTSVLGFLPAMMGGGRPMGNRLQQAQELYWKSWRHAPEDAIRLLARDSAKWALVQDDLAETGVSDERIRQLKELFAAIPNVNDIIRFAVKEVYTPEIAKQYGQYENFPEAGMTDATAAGLSRNLFEKQWAAHWILPGAQQAFDMLHRDIITKSEEEQLLKALDFMPYWRDKLTKLSWDMPNRIEIRMMVRYLDMPKSDVMKLLQYAGLDPLYREDAANMMIIMGKVTYWSDMVANGWMTDVELKADIDSSLQNPTMSDRIYKSIIKAEKPKKTLTDRTLTLTDIYKGLKMGYVTRDQAKELITDLNYDTFEAEFKLAVNVPEDSTATVQQARELTKGDIGAALRAGIIDTGTATAQFMKLRYSAEGAAILVKLYTPKPKAPVEPAERELTKGDIMAAVYKALIAPAVGHSMLVGIGYSAVQADFILALVPEPEAEEDIAKRLELQKADILKLYREGTIERSDAILRLGELGYSVADSTLLTTITDAEVKPPTEPKARELTKGDIVRAVQKGILSNQQGYDALVSMRYSDADSQFILSLIPDKNEVAIVTKTRSNIQAEIGKSLREGSITNDQAVDKFQKLGHTAGGGGQLATLYSKTVTLAESTKADASYLAEVITAIKRGLATPQGGYQLLLDRGFDSAAAFPSLQTVAEESPFSPVNFSEFKALTQQYKAATEVKSMPVSDDMKAAGELVAMLTGETNSLRELVKQRQAGILDMSMASEQTKAPLREAQAALVNAERSLALATENYKRIVAEWKHTR